MTSEPIRAGLARLPTPLEPAPRLSAAWGGPSVWIKRDDLTGFGLSGNKVRKLEYHVGAALDAGADTLVTCGAVQSNHCRATALVAAKAGLQCVLLLRSRHGQPPATLVGNHLLQRLAGAEVRFVTRDEWEDREQLMAAVADEVATRGGRAWVMPAGASDALGTHAFARAFAELSEQASAAGLDGATIWHAASSGGTTAGLAIGAGRARAAGVIDVGIVGSSVGESEAELRETIDGLLGDDVATSPYEITDRYVGLGYGLTTDEELAVQIEATRSTGLIWDPTYTGKALYALRKEIERGRFGSDETVVFWHTGGGFAAFAHDFGAALS